MCCTELGTDARLYLRVEFSEEIHNIKSYHSFSGKLKKEFQLKEYLNQLAWIMYPGGCLEYELMKKVLVYCGNLHP